MRTTINTLFLLSSLLLLASSAFAQKTADAEKAIDAEQYQKAKTILKTIIAAEPSKDENYFYLGWIYIHQDYPDSAKAIFSKGISVNPKSALNYVGLGAIARLDKNPTLMTQDFNNADSYAGKNDKPYIFMAKAYLIKPYVTADADMALFELTKAAKHGLKDPEYFITKGDAYHAKLDNNNAYSSYSDAETLDANAAYVKVAIGSLWKQAGSFSDAVDELKKALAIDPNYGPAYRTLAETDLEWARTSPKDYDLKVKEGTDYYKKYIDLTDSSPESEMRYADFLIQAHDYKTLEDVANNLAKSSKSNLRVYRYLAYAAYENNNYQAGLDAITKFMKEADPKRIIPMDYLYLGRLQIKLNQDSLGILNLKKTAELDSLHNDVYAEIAGILYKKQKYIEAGDAYKKYISDTKMGSLTDYFREGMSYYFGYGEKYRNNSSAKNDTTLLVRADSAFSFVQQKVAKPFADVFIYRARIKDLEEPDRNNIQGLAKPFYEEYITLKSGITPADERTKKNLAEAYSYLGAYYEIKEKDNVSAAENFEKARENNPDDQLAKNYFDQKQNIAAKNR